VRRATDFSVPRSSSVLGSRCEGDVQQNHPGSEVHRMKTVERIPRAIHHMTTIPFPETAQKILSGNKSGLDSVPAPINLIVGSLDSRGVIYNLLRILRILRTPFAAWRANIPTICSLVSVLVSPSRRAVLGSAFPPPSVRPSVVLVSGTRPGSESGWPMSGRGSLSAMPTLAGGDWRGDFTRVGGRR
jgi:hypothetical protein